MEANVPFSKVDVNGTNKVITAHTHRATLYFTNKLPLLCVNFRTADELSTFACLLFALLPEKSFHHSQTRKGKKHNLANFANGNLLLRAKSIHELIYYAECMNQSQPSWKFLVMTWHALDALWKKTILKRISFDL